MHAGLGWPCLLCRRLPLQKPCGFHNVESMAVVEARARLASGAFLSKSKRSGFSEKEMPAFPVHSAVEEKPKTSNTSAN